MKRINILDPQAAALIAAGEIAENPASVVKELLENSIDAGAKRIVLEIKNGGIRLIKVSDDGHGIYKDDVKDAFKRYATSKIKTKAQIDSINTLGFRGEALASIASVAKVEVVTRSEEEKIGTKFFIKGGIEENFSEAGRFVGTDILVKDLFYNTPARKKFLKKENIESGKVASLIDKIALSHPEISFKFIKDEKCCLFTPGDGNIESAICAVYEKSFLDNSMAVNKENEIFKISGFVSKPHAGRPNKNMQIFFINGRLVKSKLIAFALEEAFKNEIMINKNPYCVIHLKVPFEFVDVNIHPSKTEVRFKAEKEISDFIYTSIKEAISKEKRKENLGIYINKSINEKNDLNGEKLEFSFKDFSSTSTSENTIDISYLNNFLSNKEDTHSDFKSNKKENIKLISNMILNKSLRENYKVIGEIFGCYLAVEFKNTLILIDKHAAHERIIFEKLKNQSKDYSSQILLSPVRVTLEKEEYLAVIENLNLFSKAGYEIEDFGLGSVIVRSAPMYEIFDELNSSITEIATSILQNKKSTETKKLEWIYENIACRNAIKAKSKTSVEELIKLVEDVADNPELRHCPHGRPIYIKLEKSLIEKRFGRI